MSNSVDTCALTAIVASHNGAPALFINGEPHTGLALFRKAKGAEKEIRLFADAGVHVLSFGLGISGCLKDDDTLDTERLDQIFSQVLACDPRIIVLPRVGLDISYEAAPAWLRDRWKSEFQECTDMKTGKPCSPRLSFSSRKWREVMGAKLDELITHCEKNWGDRVLGYHLGAGASGEWAYSWWDEFGDFSVPQQIAFREWLVHRYGHSVEALREAWHNQEITFENAVIPHERLRAPDQSCFYDPLRERTVIDYMNFHSDIVADAIAHFTGTARSVLRRIERQKLIGVFYGYHLKRFYCSFKFQNSGHLAGDRVLTNPDIDFICAPSSYECRYEGGIFHSQVLAGSLRLHGKLLYSEDDTFTFKTEAPSHRYRCPDLRSTVGVLKRNLAGVLHDGATQWWMECYERDNWYVDEGLMRAVADLNGLARRRLAMNREPSSQIAVFSSDSSPSWMRTDSALIDSLLVRTIHELSIIGTSYDLYRYEDLERLLASPWSRNYRLLIFLDAFEASQELPGIVQSYRERTGGMVLWLYGAGFLDYSGYNLSQMEKVTGFAFSISDQKEPLIVDTALSGERVFTGSDRPVSPVFYGVESPGAQVLGRYVASGKPGIMSRMYEKGESVWSGTPLLSAAVLRALSMRAGVHLYTRGGHQVFADNGFLTVHAGFSGVHSIELQDTATVCDVFTGENVAVATKSFSVHMQQGDTLMWELQTEP